jgi:hypothetical protein
MIMMVLFTFLILPQLQKLYMRELDQILFLRRQVCPGSSEEAAIPPALNIGL